jgi:flagellar basal body-associated protein FliL
MLNEEVKREELRKIVDAQVKKAFDDRFQKELTASLKTGAGKKEMQAAIKDALNNLYKFMYVKRNTWNNEIK